MNYSKIESIEVINFMSYKNAKVIFDESGIINFKGYNHSGKSAFLRAIASCLMNLHSRTQSKYIHHGEDYFRIIVSFDDGVVIIRDKYLNGQSLYEMYKDKKCIFTTKQGNKLSKVDEIPKVISDYLGLIQIQGGYLNYQTRKDPLWLVDTKGSENYYSLHEVLRTEEIARANALLNSDKNELNSKITEIEIDLNQSQMLLMSYSSINEILVLTLSEKETEVQTLLSRDSSIQKIKSILDELEGIKDIPSIEGIDYSKLNSIEEIDSTLSEIESYPNYPEVSKIPFNQLSSVLNLKQLLNEFKSINNNLSSIEIDTINIDKYPSIGRLKSELDELIKVTNTLKSLKLEEKNLEKEKSSVLLDAEKEGIQFVVCDNCGTMLEVK